MADNVPATRQSTVPRIYRAGRHEYQTTNTHVITDAKPSRGGGSAGPPPKTEYVYVRDRQRRQTGGGVRGFIANREVIFGAWIVAMAVVCWDEWENYGILPRPARLWYTSLLYFILALVGGIEMLVPLVNVIAIAFVITLLYQYFNHSGQFADSGSALTGAASAATGTGSLSGIGAGITGALSGLGAAIGAAGVPSAPSGGTAAQNNPTGTTNPK
jgi:hypothetical protein